MNILRELSAGLPEGRVEQIAIGSHWTAVAIRSGGGLRCGLASNPFKGEIANPGLQKDLEDFQHRQPASFSGFAARHPSQLSSVWVAAINALLPQQPEKWVDRNAGEVIAVKGKEKRVALVGHFPFVEELREEVGELNVLELVPREGDLSADKAPEIIPAADVVAITSMTLINGTLEYLLSLCLPSAYVIVLGPSTPLSPLMFDYGIDMLCGSIVENIDPVFNSVRSGDHFRKIKTRGVRLVTIER